VEGQLPGDHLVEDDAHRVEVAAGVELPPLGLLRAHVLGGAAHQAGLGEARCPGARLLDLGDAEVEHLDEVRLVAAPLDHHVLGLQVAVDDPAGVCLAQGREDLGADPDDAGLRQRELLGDDAGEVPAGQVLHGHEQRPVLGLAEVEHGDGVGVVEAGGGLGLAVEPLRHLRVVGEAAVQHLQDHRPVQGEVAGLVDLAHATLADERLDLELAVHDRTQVGVGRGRGARRGRPAEGAEARLVGHLGAAVRARAHRPAFYTSARVDPSGALG
jgi:hypothetical protein